MEILHIFVPSCVMGRKKVRILIYLIVNSEIPVNFHIRFIYVNILSEGIYYMCERTIILKRERETESLLERGENKHHKG